MRLHFLVEGPTEQAFVNDLLVGYLEGHGVYAFTKRLDGITSYGRMRRDLRRFLLDQSRDARFTTMIDYYGRPRDFPGSSEALSPDQVKDPLKRVEFLEKKLAEDIGDWRFIPYLQLREFEALLFTDISVLSKQYSEHADAIRSPSVRDARTHR